MKEMGLFNRTKPKLRYTGASRKKLKEEEK
jgi:hypothetical protein